MGPVFCSASLAQRPRSPHADDARPMFLSPARRHALLQIFIFYAFSLQFIWNLYLKVPGEEAFLAGASPEVPGRPASLEGVWEEQGLLEGPHLRAEKTLGTFARAERHRNEVKLEKLKETVSFKCDEDLEARCNLLGFVLLELKGVSFFFFWLFAFTIISWSSPRCLECIKKCFSKLKIWSRSTNINRSQIYDRVFHLPSSHIFLSSS